MTESKLLDLVFNPWSSHALFTGCRLRIFTLLAGTPMSDKELGQQAGATSRAFTALLDACVGMGLLRSKDGVYSNTHISDAYLVEGRPVYLGDLIEVQAAEAADWHRLSDVIGARGGEQSSTPRQEVDPRRFTLAMHNIAMLGEAEALAAAVDLSGAKEMADVGCGSGMYSVALCRRHPGLKAILLDRREVLEVAREIVEGHGLQDRITTREADITKDAYGEDLDAVLLSDVLYQDEATCKRILRSAHGALRNGGRLVVRGYFSDPEGSNPLFGALFVLKLLLSDPTREPISVAKLRGWVEEAGFHHVESFALTQRSTCFAAIK